MAIIHLAASGVRGVVALRKFPNNALSEMSREQ